MRVFAMRACTLYLCVCLCLLPCVRVCLCVKEGTVSDFIWGGGGVDVVEKCQLYDPCQLQNEISRNARMCKVYTDVGDTRLSFKKA